MALLWRNDAFSSRPLFWVFSFAIKSARLTLVHVLWFLQFNGRKRICTHKHAVILISHSLEKYLSYLDRTQVDHLPNIWCQGSIYQQERASPLMWLVNEHCLASRVVGSRKPGAGCSKPFKYAFFAPVLMMEETCLPASRDEEKESKEVEVGLKQKRSSTGHHEWQACLGSIKVREEREFSEGYCVRGLGPSHGWEESG